MDRASVVSKFVMFLVITLFITISVGTVKAAANDEYKEIVIKGYEKLLALKSYHMTLETTGSMAFLGQTVNIAISGECDTQVKPMLAKNLMTIRIGTAPTVNEQKIVQYIEQSKEQVIIYSNTKGNWERQAMPYYDPLKEYASYAKAISAVTLAEEKDDVNIFNVTIDGNALGATFEQAMNSININKAGLPEGFFKNIGDLTYQVAIDKKTATVCSAEIDMTPVLAALGNNITNNGKLSDNEKVLMYNMFSNTKLVTTVTFSKFNSVSKIIIPNEVRTKSLPVKII